jgi:hypothetical protein
MNGRRQYCLHVFAKVEFAGYPRYGGLLEGVVPGSRFTGPGLTNNGTSIATR